MKTAVWTALALALAQLGAQAQSQQPLRPGVSAPASPALAALAQVTQPAPKAGLASTT